MLGLQLLWPGRQRRLQLQHDGSAEGARPIDWISGQWRDDQVPEARGRRAAHLRNQRRQSHLLLGQQLQPATGCVARGIERSVLAVRLGTGSSVRDVVGDRWKYSMATLPSSTSSFGEPNGRQQAFE